MKALWTGTDAWEYFGREGSLHEEGIVEKRTDPWGHFRKEGLCMIMRRALWKMTDVWFHYKTRRQYTRKTLWKDGLMLHEALLKGRGYTYGKEDWCIRGLWKPLCTRTALRMYWCMRALLKGGDNTWGSHYRREDWCWKGGLMLEGITEGKGLHMRKAGLIHESITNWRGELRMRTA